MRFDGPGSSNIEDHTGERVSRGFGGGMGGGVFGLIFQLVASKFGIVGIVVLMLGYCALNSFGGGGGLGGGKVTPGESQLDPQTRQFMSQVLGSTEQVWGEIFRQAGAQLSAVFACNH